VFIGVDGVVPMAKMRQQRLRRFKSRWVAEEEVRIGKSEVNTPKWDTNAITPGTAFMERLGSALLDCKSEGIRWVISNADVPGEGEHKAMHGIRNCIQRESHVIYGLDADLILLALLQPIHEMWLFREAVECGEVQYKDNEEEYRYFSIHKLRNFLQEDKDEDYLLDYCMAMSLVGNDFLPHGLALKLKDGGHDMLLQMLKDVRKANGPLITSKVQISWNKKSLLACIHWLADKEEDLVRLHCNKKIGQRYQQARGTTAIEIAIDEWNKTPLRICEELALIHSIHRGDDSKLNVQLLDSWRNMYYDRWLGGIQNVNKICYEYFIGLDWILQYYTGNDVNAEWCFPWLLPPLYSDLLAYIHASESLPLAKRGNTNTIKPQEQLALVLPLSSWWLIRDSKLRRIPQFAPQFWPSSFELFTAGHKQIWECEAQIPLFFPERLRMLLNQVK
jgi:5'-3' exoribonuclease 1